jgi:hypothetical protein
MEAEIDTRYSCISFIDGMYEVGLSFIGCTIYIVFDLADILLRIEGIHDLILFRTGLSDACCRIYAKLTTE